MVFSEADDKFYGLFAPMVFHYIKKRETAAPPLPSPFVVAPLLFYHPSSSPSAAWFLHFDGKKFTLSIVHHFFGVGSTCAIDAAAMMTSDLLY